MRLLLVISIVILFSLPIKSQSFAENYINIGIMLHEKKQYESAIETYKKGYQIDSTSYIGITALYEIAYSYAALEDYEKANIFIFNYLASIRLADVIIFVYNLLHSALYCYLLKSTILFDNVRHLDT